MPGIQGVARYVLLATTLALLTALALSTFVNVMNALPPGNVVDPSATSEATKEPYQRKVFYAHGRYWVFYCDGIFSGKIVYRTSTDGATWSAKTTVRTGCYSGNEFAVWFNGTHVFYAFIPTQFGTTQIYFRVGIPRSDGTIEWVAGEQVAYSGYPANPYITVDSRGYAWIAFVTYNPQTRSLQYPYVIKNAVKDGTWVTDGGFPQQLASYTSYWYVVLVPLLGGKITAIYTSYDDVLRIRAWTGTGWLDEVVLDSYYVLEGRFVSAVANGDTTHIVFLSNSFSVVYTRYVYGDSSVTYTRVIADGEFANPPALSLDEDTGDLYVFTFSSNDIVLYRRYVASTNEWQDWVHWLDETSDHIYFYDTITSTYSTHGGTDVFVIYIADDYILKFGKLTTESPPTTTSGPPTTTMPTTTTPTTTPPPPAYRGVTVDTVSADILGMTFQRFSFRAHNMTWVFGVNGTHVVYWVSEDGVVWRQFPVRKRDSDLLPLKGSQLCIHFNGTHVFYAFLDRPLSSLFKLYFRVGVPRSDGTIGWVADEQTVYTSFTGMDYPSIAVDSRGYAWVSFSLSYGNEIREYTVIVIKNAVKDGTWVTDEGFPADLAELGFAFTTYLPWGSAVLPLPDGKVAVAYAANSSLSGLRIVVWGGGWGNMSVLQQFVRDGIAHSEVVVGDAVHVVLVNTAGNIVYAKYVSGSGGFTDVTTLHAGARARTNVTIAASNTTGEVVVFASHLDDPHHIYYVRRRSGYWDAWTDWIDGIDKGVYVITSAPYTYGDLIYTLFYTTVPTTGYYSELRYAPLPEFPVVVPRVYPGAAPVGPVYEVGFADTTAVVNASLRAGLLINGSSFTPFLRVGNETLYGEPRLGLSYPLDIVLGWRCVDGYVSINYMVVYMNGGFTRYVMGKHAFLNVTVACPATTHPYVLVLEGGGAGVVDRYGAVISEILDYMGFGAFRVTVVGPVPAEGLVKYFTLSTPVKVVYEFGSVRVEPGGKAPITLVGFRGYTLSYSAAGVTVSNVLITSNEYLLEFPYGIALMVVVDPASRTVSLVQVSIPQAPVTVAPTPGGGMYVPQPQPPTAPSWSLDFGEPAFIILYGAMIAVAIVASKMTGSIPRGIMTSAIAFGIVMAGVGAFTQNLTAVATAILAFIISASVEIARRHMPT